MKDGEILILLAERQRYRETQSWQEADAIRLWLSKQDVQLQDRPMQVWWRRKVTTYVWGEWHWISHQELACATAP